MRKERGEKNVLNLGNDLVIVKSGNAVGLGGLWGCAWGQGERKVEKPGKPLCCCEMCVPPVAAAKKRVGESS